MIPFILRNVNVQLFRRCCSVLSDEGVQFETARVFNLTAVFNGRAVIEKEQDSDNIKHILNAVRNVDTVIYAAGTGHMTNKNFRNRQKELLEQLTDYEDKLMCIADVVGKKFYHPLCPSVRKWELVPFKLSELLDMTAQHEGDTERMATE